MTKSQLKEEILKTCFNSANKLNPYIFDNRSKIYNEQITTKILEYTETFNQYKSTFKERVYVLLNDIEDRPKCFCGNPTIFKGKWYTEYCSTKCQHTSPKRLGNIKEKWANKTKEEKDTHVKRNKESKLRNHGNENYNNPKKISETWSNKSEEEIQDFANKGKATKLEKYGAENYCNKEKILETKANFSEEKKEEIKDKIKETCMERYGTTSPLQSPEVLEKIKQTWIENFGYEHPMKCPEYKEKLMNTKIENNTLPSNLEIREKSSKTWQAKSNEEMQEIAYKKLTTGVKTKTYIMPSGKEVLYQGYENFAIDILLKRFSEDDLDIHPNISIPYIHKNKKRRYLPDILIKSSNTIIEVKSTWTYEKDLEVNKLKEQACLNNGYNFKFIILTDKSEIKRYE